MLIVLHTMEASLEALESNVENVKSQDPIGKIDKHVDSTLFTRGSCMQSYWKGPGSHTKNDASFPIKSLKKALNEAGLEALISFPVVHCPQAFGVVLQGANKINGVGKTLPARKIVHSGDTRPCPELVKASFGAMVLIHERKIPQDSSVRRRPHA